MLSYNLIFLGIEMSYNQKPSSSGSGVGSGPPNSPNNMPPQVSKSFVGIQQQMQSLVHGQNSLPQSSQSDINAFLQQQRIQTMLKQQQQFLQLQHQMQQHQQQQQQHHNIGISSSGSSGIAPCSSGTGAEPLALTRNPVASDLLNKSYQQQANGNPGTNSSFNQLQQTLQAFPTNFVQQLQAIQYQMQAKQMQQHVQSNSGQAQLHQPLQGVISATPTTPTVGYQQQKISQQQQQQQQQTALSNVAAMQQLQQRYLSAAVQVAAGNKKLSNPATTTSPPATNHLKSNLPNSQVAAISSGTPVNINAVAANPKTQSSLSTPTINASQNVDVTGNAFSNKQASIVASENKQSINLQLGHKQSKTESICSQNISKEVSPTESANQTRTPRLLQSNPIKLTKQNHTTEANKNVINLGVHSNESSLETVSTTPETKTVNTTPIITNAITLTHAHLVGQTEDKFKMDTVDKSVESTKEIKTFLREANIQNSVLISSSETTNVQTSLENDDKSKSSINVGENTPLNKNASNENLSDGVTNLNCNDSSSDKSNAVNNKDPKKEQVRHFQFLKFNCAEKQNCFI